jgi:hypothetical protein
MTLENLLRINQLKREPPDRREFEYRGQTTVLMRAEALFQVFSKLSIMRLPWLLCSLAMTMFVSIGDRPQ